MPRWDDHRERFGSVERLLGRSAFDRLRGARACVIGLGGVGSWTVEALARSGLGGLTLVDLDDVCVTNTNRQLHALGETVGQPKAAVLAARVRAISPTCAAVPVLAFVTSANVERLLTGPFDVVIDCIDVGRLKAEIVATAHRLGQPVVCVGGAGGRRDPTAVRTGDLGVAAGDVLLRRVRRELRSNHGFPRATGPTAGPMGVRAIWSTERPVYRGRTDRAGRSRSRTCRSRWTATLGSARRPSQPGRSASPRRPRRCG